MAAPASKPEFGVVEEELHVAMRDGTRIGLRVYRPDSVGRFPALFAASPYQ